MKKVIVTGASGFIGGRLAALLLESGCIVYGVGENFSCSPELVRQDRFIPIEAGFSDYSTLNEKIADRKIDVFYHFAWAGGFLQDTLRDYDLQLKNACEACNAVRYAVELGAKKFVYAGTVNEIESEQYIRTFEHFQTRPTCIYAACKLAAELICRTLAQEKGIAYNSGLIPMIYGKGNRSRQLINVVLESLLKGEAPRLTEGGNQYDIVCVEDVARAFAAIGEKGVDGKRYYIGHRKLKTFRAWMEEIRDIVAPSVPLRFGEYADSLNLDYSLIDLDALFQDTGFECRADFSKTILENAEWIKLNQMKQGGSYE